MAENSDPNESVSSNKNQPRGSPQIKQKFELEFKTDFS
jgi:hypothetical protein